MACMYPHYLELWFKIKANIVLSCWTRICPAFANSEDPDQLASSEANWSGSALFAIQYVTFISNLDQVIWLADS